MIDDKKIEAAANKHIETEYARYNSGEVEEEMICLRGKDSFKAGAKWMQEEFLNGLWHPASEEPKENFDLVYINKTKEFREISSYNSDRFDDLFGEGWEAACRMFGIYKWAYKDDLLPKKGGEQ